MRRARADDLLRDIAVVQKNRIFDIADASFSQVSDEEKKKYLSRILETGSFQGYKLRQYWVRPPNRMVVLINFSDRCDSMSTAGSWTRWRRTMVLLLNDEPRCSLKLGAVNRIVTKRDHPDALRPLLPELDAFARHNHFNILHPILRYVPPYTEWHGYMTYYTDLLADFWRWG